MSIFVSFTGRLRNIINLKSSNPRIMQFLFVIEADKIVCRLIVIIFNYLDNCNRINRANRIVTTRRQEQKNKLA